MQIVLDDALAEGYSGHLGALQLGDRLAERLGHLGQRRVLVRIALVELGGLQLVAETVQASGDGRRASLVFTMEGKLAERFGQLDRELIDSLKLSPTPLEETTEPTPAGKAKSARGKSATMSK